ncbi:MAG: hypothetical protein ACFE8U_14165 [Candidatus Hermodarchaeota archaeon]
MTTSFIEQPDIETIINQLVCQQFFLHPNIIVDRTHRIKIKVQGGEYVFRKFSEFLHQISNQLCGTEPGPYIALLSEAGQKLQLEHLSLERRFQAKAGSFLREGLATESILFISTIASILEVLDVEHYHQLLKMLRSAFQKYCENYLKKLKPKDQMELFEAGIKRLGEVADPNFSILQNMIKLVDLAEKFEVKDLIVFDEKKFDEFTDKIVNKIVSGEY